YARRHQTDAAPPAGCSETSAWRVGNPLAGVGPRSAEIRQELESALKQARNIRKNPLLRQLPPYWDAYQGGAYDPALEVATAVPAEELKAIGELMVRVPAG